MVDDRDRGLYGKYVVRRSDGSSEPGGKHEHCDYFVLDLVHDAHASAALAAYATSCETEYPALYDDLTDRLARYRSCSPLRVRVKGKPGGELHECFKPAVIPLGNGLWFCTEHAVDFHVRGHELGSRAMSALMRRGVEVPPGRLMRAVREDDD
jgi:hypothetical protein